MDQPIRRTLNKWYNRPPPSFDELNALREQTHGIVDGAIDFIVEIDRILMGIDCLMHVLQPFETGRIGIKFIKNNGKIRVQARKYTRVKGNKFFSAYISYKGLRRRVRRSRAFECNHRLMQTLCDYATTLMQLRVDMLGRLSKLDLGVTNARMAQSKKVAEIRDTVGAMLGTLEKRDTEKMQLENEEEEGEEYENE